VLAYRIDTVVRMAPCIRFYRVSYCLLYYLVEQYTYSHGAELNWFLFRMEVVLNSHPAQSPRLERNKYNPMCLYVKLCIVLNTVFLDSVMWNTFVGCSVLFGLGSLYLELKLNERDISPCNTPYQELNAQTISL